MLSIDEGAMVGVAIAVNGVLSNLAVYLIQQYNMGSIQATQIFNIINGCISLAPILGGIISDSWLGCYSVITIASAACLLVSKELGEIVLVIEE